MWGGESYCRWLHKKGLSEEALSKVPKEVKGRVMQGPGVSTSGQSTVSAKALKWNILEEQRGRQEPACTGLH